MDKKEIKKIALFRALQLGDMLCALPAIRALKHTYPKAEIWLIGLPAAAGLVARFSHYFKGLIPFPGYPGLPEQDYDIRKIGAFTFRMQEEKLDMLLQMQGNGHIVNPLIELWGGRYTGGFYREGDYRPSSGLFMPYPDYGHEIRRHLLLMQHIGVRNTENEELEFPLTQSDQEGFRQLNLPVAPGEYVCIHPGSRGKWRQWPPAYFAELADRCMEQKKQVVITGTKEEIPIAEAVSGHMRSRPIVVAGKTRLGAMGILLKGAYGLISNCTGISHMASALKTPGLIISMDGEPYRWGPLNKTLFCTVDWITNPDRLMVRRALDSLLRNRSFQELAAGGSSYR